MRWIGWIGLALLLLSLPASASESAWMGTAFSDVYAAFAPLSLLHRAYAEYLFSGTEVDTPSGLAGACGRTGVALAEMHIGLLSQTGSQVVGTIPRLTRLRSDLASLCSTYAEPLESISRASSPDVDVLSEAAQLGLFSGIYDVQQGLQFVFEAYLAGIPSDEGTWEFAVSFSLHTLLMQVEIPSIDPSLQAILYGAEDATTPPAFVPIDIAEAIALLVESIESVADEGWAENVRDLAERIYTYVLESP